MKMENQNKKHTLYIFLDEGGNLDFSRSGTKYFTLTALSKERPFEAYKHLNELKYDLIELGREIEYFRASEDRQVVRDVVFINSCPTNGLSRAKVGVGNDLSSQSFRNARINNIIDTHLDRTRIYTLIVEKRKQGLLCRKRKDSILKC